MTDVARRRMNLLQSGEKDEAGGGGESALSKWMEARKGKKEKKQKLVGKPGKDRKSVV